jgi:serine/threonine protein kinase
MESSSAGMTGRTLAHYRVEQEIGAGGMGVVYRAQDLQLERPVALKIVGEKDQLDRALRMGDDREGWLRRDPHLAGIRDNPRFQQMLASVAYRRAQRVRAQ